MNTNFDAAEFAAPPAPQQQVWAVGALTRAVADALAARFNPVTVRGEVAGFTRATSGHCYFSLKDENGQLRCAMFRRAAGLLNFAPHEGDQVQVRGRLAVYEPRGDLQLVVESMERAGQGALFEQFLQLKARLEAQGLFDPARKRPLPAMPRGVGIVTSLGAAALRDVLSTLARRAPHLPILIAPAAVQGPQAPAQLCQALQNLYAQRTQPLDAILLVRGGGSIEDLWAFSDERLARVIAASPVPIISGVGHETDFSIADFVADLRAPTPTAAAELVCPAQADAQAALHASQRRLQHALRRRLDMEAQRLDWLGARIGRPAQTLADERLRLQKLAQTLRHTQTLRLQAERARLTQWASRLPRALPPRLLAERTRLQQLAHRLPLAMQQALHTEHARCQQAAARLHALAPQRVLERGYAWLQDETGRPLTQAAAAQPGQQLRATLADGQLQVQVQGRSLL